MWRPGALQWMGQRFQGDRKMTSRQFSRPGRKQLRRTRVLRDPRSTHAWRNAFISLFVVAMASYALALSISLTH
jgi:hypothetical protein